MSIPRPRGQQNTGPAMGLTAPGGSARREHAALRSLRKVPEVTAYFWVIKLLTTGMGETTSDYLVHQLDPPVAVALGAIRCS